MVGCVPSGLAMPQIADVTIIDASCTANKSIMAPPTAAYPSKSTWVKLSMPELLPPFVERVLYMDADMHPCHMVALTNLDPLWEVPLQGGTEGRPSVAEQK